MGKGKKEFTKNEEARGSDFTSIQLVTIYRK